MSETMFIEGVVANSFTDRDGQTCNEGWLESALGEWMNGSKNVTRDFRSHVIGKAVSLAEIDGDWVLKVRVSDEVTQRDIEWGALRALTIGIRKATVTNGHEIVGGVIDTVSLVSESAFNVPPLAITTFDEGETINKSYRRESE